jgi:hypothetical protein
VRQITIVASAPSTSPAIGPGSISEDGGPATPSVSKSGGSDGDGEVDEDGDVPDNEPLVVLRLSTAGDAASREWMSEGVSEEPSADSTARLKDWFSVCADSSPTRLCDKSV